MIMDSQVPFRVLLPDRFWKEAFDREHFKMLVAEYMKTRYPNYIVKRIEDHFAICERKE